MGEEDRDLLLLRRLRDLSHRIATERDVAHLIPAVLDAAIELTDAERGFLVLVTGAEFGVVKDLKVEVARGFDKTELAGAQGSVSRTVVERVLQSGAGLVTSTHEDEALLEVSSVKERRVLSIVCAPLRRRGETCGVLYLDHRFTKHQFSAGELDTLEAFADQAALALETTQILASQPESSASPLFPGDDPLVGESPVMTALREEIHRAARGMGPVLVMGEQGSGKGLVAREIHRLSPRAKAPFLEESCAGRNESSLASDLFGHVAGALPWAKSDRKGLFVLAGKGMLCLREIESLSPQLQSLLFLSLRRGETRPLGAERAEPYRSRLLALSDSTLRDRVEAGTFRRDLYYQLDVVRVTVPPLRQRPSDIPLLIRTFAAVEKRKLTLTDQARDLLHSYTWPGNVAELRHEVIRLCALAKPRVGARDLSLEIQEASGVPRAAGDVAGKTLPQVEKELIEVALRDCGGSKAKAARQLGIPRSTLYGLIRKHGLPG